MSFWSGFEEKRKWILKDNFILEFKANDDEMNRKIYCCNPWTLLFLFSGDEYFRFCLIPTKMLSLHVYLK